MEHTMRSSEIDLPGFRFHPTEEELLDFYLKNTVFGFGKKLRLDVIGCVNIYHHDPWDLPGLSKVGEREWYFFVPRDRRHGNGGRPNRTTERGFWKATGSDRRILSQLDSKLVLGLRKTLVFYRGRAPKGTKTDWIMNEYRLPDAFHPLPKDMVLCKVYRKATSFRVLEQRAMVEEQLKASQTSSSSTEMQGSFSRQQEDVSELLPLKREAREDDGSVALEHHQATHKKPKPKPSSSSSFSSSSTSTSLQMPLGYDPLPELQLPTTNQIDWTQDQLWTQLNSPWLQNWGHYANILNF